MKFVNLDEFTYNNLCQLDLVSVDGIHRDIKNDLDIIEPTVTTTIGASCQNPYFIVNNLFSELQTYEQKKKALENLQIPDVVEEFIQEIREPIINWSESFDLNDIIDHGVYTIIGIRESNERDHLPINNFNNNASISAKLFVTVSPEENTMYRSIIGQTLFLSNAEDNETKIYIRSANKTSHDEGISYEITWGDWQVCQGMKEVGLVNSYDSFIDNGSYSGIYDNDGITETFVIITINDQAIKSQLNQPKSVSQLKYALNASTNKSELSIRVGGGQNFAWGEWEPVFDEEHIITQIDTIQNRLNTLTAGTTGSINEIISKAINDLIEGAPDTYDTLKEIADYIENNASTAADIITSIAALKTRIYELGNFSTSEAAENAAKDPSISGNNEIVIMRYTISSKSKQGILIQQVGDYRTVQYIVWDASIYTRHIWFTNNNRNTIDTSYSNNWWKMGGTHIKYDPSTRKIGLENMNNGMMNQDNTAVLPLATKTQHGLMSKEQVSELAGKASVESVSELQQEIEDVVGNFNEIIPKTISEADKQSMEENGTWDEFAQSHTLIYIYEDDNT